MIHIIAGSEIQAEAWIRTQGLTEAETTIINDPDQLNDNAQYVLIGSHYNRPDIMKLKLELSRCRAKQLDSKTLKEMR